MRNRQKRADPVLSIQEPESHGEVVIGESEYDEIVRGCSLGGEDAARRVTP